MNTDVPKRQGAAPALPQLREPHGLVRIAVLVILASAATITGWRAARSLHARDQLLTCLMLSVRVKEDRGKWGHFVTLTASSLTSWVRVTEVNQFGGLLKLAESLKRGAHSGRALRHQTRRARGRRGWR